MLAARVSPLRGVEVSMVVSVALHVIAVWRLPYPVLGQLPGDPVVWEAMQEHRIIRIETLRAPYGCVR